MSSQKRMDESTALVSDAKASYFGEKDGEQMLPLAVQWPLTFLIYGVIVAVVTGIGSSKGPLVTLGIPVLVLLLSYTLAISFAGYPPPKSILILMAAYWSAFIVFYFLDAIVPFVIGSMIGVVHWFYLVVQLMGKASGQDQGEAYVNYTFLAPLQFSIGNALCYKIEEWTIPGIRYPLATGLGLLINLLVGKLGGAYHFSVVQYVRYIAGSGGLYVFVYYGIMRNLEVAIIAWAKSHPMKGA